MTQPPGLDDLRALDDLFARARADGDLARRLLRVGTPRPHIYASTVYIADRAYAELAWSEHERLIIAASDVAGNLTHWRVQHVGTAQQVVVDIPGILRTLLHSPLRADKVWVAHNHPSGNPDHSAADIQTAIRIANAIHVCGMQFVASIVVTNDPDKWSFHPG